MTHKRKHSDVSWCLPGRKRPFTYTTIATSDLITVLASQTKNKTPKEILSLITYDPEAKAVMQGYIDKGYGDTPLNLR